MKGLLGTKVGMTQIWRDDKLIPVTVVLAGPCPVVQRKTADRDGYSAVQLGWQEKSLKRANKAEQGHAKRAEVEPQRYLREFRDYNPEETQITVDIFAPGQKVDVTGKSKGRGMTGVIKRWGFSGMGASHGVKKKHRHPGSIGQRKSPGRVHKGKKMAGHYGHERVTTVGLELVEVRSDDNLLLIRGSIPGPNGGLLVIKDSKRGVS